MNRLFSVLVPAIILAAPSFASAAEAEPIASREYSTQNGSFKWYTNFDQAKKAAAKENKPILVVFTGSDWCAYCARLDKELFHSSDFRKWARAKAILYIADTQGGIKNISNENRELMMRLGRGSVSIPMMYFTDREGKSFGQIGYKDIKAAEYVKHFDAILSSKK